MTHKPGKQIVAKFFAAVGRGDLEAVMGFFTDDSVYTVVGDPTGTPPLDAESKKAIYLKPPNNVLHACRRQQAMARECLYYTTVFAR